MVNPGVEAEDTLTPIGVYNCAYIAQLALRQNLKSYMRISRMRIIGNRKDSPYAPLSGSWWFRLRYFCIETYPNGETRPTSIW